jgi:hypothetical protein
MLMAYISSLKAWHIKKSVALGKPTRSPDKWEQAISSANEALEKFRDAEVKRQTQLIDEANALVQQAMESLRYRYGSSRIASNY